jgi:hypothetical protein
MTQMSTQERVTDMRPHLNHERIIGILIYAVMRNQLTAEIIQLARTVPKEYYDNPGDGWDMVGYFVHTKGTKGDELDERSVEYRQDMLRSEIGGIAAWIAAGRPGIGEVDWFGGEDTDDE